MGRFIEVCAVSVADILEAAAGGAQRVELCENLEVGGVTPSRELLAAAIECGALPVNVLVRPRGGNFVYTPGEEASMMEDIRMCRELGAAGVVIGALTEDSDVDMSMMRRLISEARPLSVTFHRAFDRARDPFRALEDVISLGCDRLLTSGQQPSSFDGHHLLAELVERAAGRIIIMPGGGVRVSNIEEIAALTRAKEFHSTSRGDSGATERDVVAKLAGNQ